MEGVRKRESPEKDEDEADEDLFSLTREQLIKRVLSLKRQNQQLRAEIGQNYDEVADLQFQLLRARGRTTASPDDAKRYVLSMACIPDITRTRFEIEKRKLEF